MKGFCSNDFFDLVRSIAGDIVEEVKLVDEFVHPKTNRRSHCYRITYRHMDKTFEKYEVNEIHNRIADAAATTLGVEIRC